MYGPIFFRSTSLGSVLLLLSLLLGAALHLISGTVHSPDSYFSGWLYGFFHCQGKLSLLLICISFEIYFMWLPVCSEIFTFSLKRLITFNHQLQILKVFIHICSHVRVLTGPWVCTAPSKRALIASLYSLKRWCPHHLIQIILKNVTRFISGQPYFRTA